MPGFARFAKRPSGKTDSQGNAPPNGAPNPNKDDERKVSFAEGTKFVERTGDVSLVNKPKAPVPSFGFNNGGFGGASSFGGSGGFGFGSSLSSFGSSFQSSNTVSHF